MADDKPEGDEPHYLGHRQRLRARFLRGGGDALSDYELLELVLFTANARRDMKPLAKALVEQNQANLEQARKKLDDLMPGAPEDGLIENTFYNVGEWVPAGAPSRASQSLLPGPRTHHTP